MAVKWRKIGSIEPMTCKRKRGILISSQIGRGRRRCRFGSRMLLERRFLFMTIESPRSVDSIVALKISKEVPSHG